MSSFITFIPLASGASDGINYAFRHTDIIGQSIVIGLLLVSVITWTIMLEKCIGLSKAKNATVRFLALFREKRSLLSMKDKCANDISPLARVYESGYIRLQQLYARTGAVREGQTKPLNGVELDVLRSTLEQTVSDQIMIMEEKMTFLATAVSVSPFMGLFGTVWGITLAFTSLAIQGKADIQVLAPGVSGALLTTVLGLVVAIPSLIGYNVISILIKQTTVNMDNFVEEFVSRLKLEQLSEDGE